MGRLLCIIGAIGMWGVVSAYAQNEITDQDVGDAIVADVDQEDDTGLQHSQPPIVSEPVDPTTFDAGVQDSGSSLPFAGTQGAVSSSEFVGPPAPIFDNDTAQVSLQALLTDNNGDPLAGASVDLAVRIYEAGGGPLVEGPINVNNVPMTDGVINAQIPVSASSFDGTGREMGIRVNGAAELLPRTPLTAVPYAYRVNRVASPELDDNIDLGDATDPGFLGIWGNHNNVAQRVFEFFAVPRINMYGSDGLEQIRLWGDLWGEVLLHDDEGNQITAILSATSNFGGQLTLTDADGGPSVFANGGDGTVSAEGQIRHVANIGGTVHASLGSNGNGGGVLRTNDEAGAQTVILGSPAGGGGGFMNMHLTDSIWPGVALRADTFGSITLNQSTGVNTFATRAIIDANGSGHAVFRQSDGDPGVEIFGAIGQISGHGTDGLENWRLWNGGFGELLLFDGSVTNDRTVILSAGSGSDGGELSLFRGDGSGTATVFMDGDSGSAGLVQIRNAAGTVTITLDGDVSGDGRVTTQEINITGGSDLSEQFDIQASSGDVQPGMVVSIDPRNAGKLMVSSKAYDRTVAGIVSGAGGIKTGMLMGQEGSVANGDHPVALTGRVYCLVDASNGPIEPGDLLTTSDVPGHAMKVTDHDRSQGAIIGKAMTSLTEGKGLVLVLVSLQ